MIELRRSPANPALTDRLVARAAHLAQARLEARRRRRDPLRWRLPRLLWPLFVKER